MSQQTIKQRARRTAREMAERRRRELASRERRVVGLAERVLVALGERDAMVAAAERRAGEALREMTEQEGLSVGEAVQWCGDALSSREATRLRRLARVERPGPDATTEPFNWTTGGGVVGLTAGSGGSDGSDGSDGSAGSDGALRVGREGES